jgi:hypothetical protein
MLPYKLEEERLKSMQDVEARQRPCDDYSPICPMTQQFESLQNYHLRENFDKREKKAQITFPFRHFFPLKVVN